MRTRRSFLKQVAAGCGAAATLGAQQENAAQQDNATFSSDVKVIGVLATVRTKNGDIVADLAKEDFVLAESGRQQPIKYFSREANLPLVLGLLIDTSGSQRTVLGEEVQASYKFFEDVLREDLDRSFAVHFDSRAEVLQNLTSSKAKLQTSLERIQFPAQRGRGGGGGGTVLYDAVYLCSNLVTKKQTGRKALILLTDGEDNGSRYSIKDAIEAAQRADTLVYSILFSDATFGGAGFRPDGKSVLQKISRETGGGFFEVSKKRPLDAVYRQLQEELRSQYSIGYTPGDSAAKGFRPIKLTTRRKDLVVQARSGYYSDDTSALR